jgi:hypothetical protein
MAGAKGSLYSEGARSEKRTWFGITVWVTLGPGLIHHVRLGALSLPHPPVVNYILRLGLAASCQYKLSFAHEFAHLHTLPVVIFYSTLSVCAVVYRAGADATKIVVALITIPVFWEILSEARIYACHRSFYQDSYRMVSIVPRLIFWFAAGGLAAVCWAIILS